MLGRPALIDKLELELFAEGERLEQHFTPDERETVKRTRYGFTLWLDNPTLSHREVREKLISNFGISKRIAFKDIERLQHLLGNMKQASKEFMRMRANFMIQEGYNLAQDAQLSLEVKKAEAIIKAGMALVKINKLDKDDVLPYAWEEVKPIEYEITDDVSVLDLDPIAKTEKELEEIKEQLRAKYSDKQLTISDATVIE